jgi:hypothetical protein
MIQKSQVTVVSISFKKSDTANECDGSSPTTARGEVKLEEDAQGKL